MGHPEWIDDPRFDTVVGRRDNAESIIALCDAAFALHDRDEWAVRLDAADLTWAPVQTAEELVNDPQAAAIDLLHLVTEHPDGPFLTVNAPFIIRDADVGVRGRAPRLGEHTLEILQAAGLDPDGFDDLVARGIVGT